MRTAALAFLAAFACAAAGAGEQAGPLQPSRFPFMLRGYCHAGSRIADKNAPGGYGTSDNLPKKIDGSIENPREEVYLLALPGEETAFAKSYKGMKLLLINGTGERQPFRASDSRISIVQEAKDKDGKWKPIEYLPSSWCGNSRHTVFLGPKEYWQFSAPRYEGGFSTTLRFSLNIGGGKIIYSNEFNGAVNPKQFTEKQGHRPTSIMDPYNE